MLGESEWKNYGLRREEKRAQKVQIFKDEQEKRNTENKEENPKKSEGKQAFAMSQKPQKPREDCQGVWSTWQNITRRQSNVRLECPLDVVTQRPMAVLVRPYSTG